MNKDLIEIPEVGVATIMPDEYFNTYDKTGPGMSNYTPQSASLPRGTSRVAGC